MEKQKDQLHSFISACESVKGVIKRWTLKEPHSAQLDMVWCKWFTGMSSEGKPVPGQ